MRLFEQNSVDENKKKKKKKNKKKKAKETTDKSEHDVTVDSLQMVLGSISTIQIKEKEIHPIQNIVS